MGTSPDISNTQLWYEIIKDILTIASVVLVLLQLKSNSASKLYDQYLKLNELFLAHPELRPYFYDDRTVPPDASDDLKAQVASMAEAIMGILEHAALQRRNLPRKSWKECWEKFTEDRLKTSPSVRQFYVDNDEIYARDLRILINDLGLTLPQKSCRLQQRSIASGAYSS